MKDVDPGRMRVGPVMDGCDYLAEQMTCERGAGQSM